MAMRSARLSLLPDIQRAGERFARLAADEQESGALTGTSGSGSVVQLLSQMSAQMKELETTIQSSREPIQQAFEQGQKHLAAMRGLVSAPGPIEQRSDQFAAESVALSGVIASLEQTSIAASVSRAAADLSVGLHRARCRRNIAGPCRPAGPGDDDHPRFGGSAVQGAG